MADTINKADVKKFAKDLNDKFQKISKLEDSDMEPDDSLDKIGDISKEAVGYVKAFMEFHGLD